MTPRIPIPTYDGGPDSGTRADRADYLEPMAERWPGGDLLSLVEWLGVESSLQRQPDCFSVEAIDFKLKEPT